MHWHASWDTGWMWGMHLLGWLLWAALAGIVCWVVARSASPGGPSRPESPSEILRRRYAEGALTTEEYEERRRKLMDSSVLKGDTS